MKRVALILVAALLLAGCEKKRPAENATAPPEPKGAPTVDSWGVAKGYTVAGICPDGVEVYRLEGAGLARSAEPSGHFTLLDASMTVADFCMGHLK